MSSRLTSKNVLLIRLSAIGDIVMASGLPQSIKASNPEVKVTWLVEATYGSLVQHHPYVDNVILWPRHEWQSLLKQHRYLSLLKAILAFKAQLRYENFDCVIDAQGLLKSAVLGWLSGAEKRIGFYSKEKSHWLYTQALAKRTSNQISSEYRQLAECFGNAHYILMMEQSSRDKLTATYTLNKHSIADKFIALAPFTTRPQKHWLNEHWFTLINTLRKQSSLPIVILGGPNDEAAGNELTQKHSLVYSMAGKLTLSQSAFVVSQSQLVIGVDTGLTHMGIAQQRPTIALFGSTCPYTITDNPTSHVIYKPLSCSPCKRRPTCNGTFDCMASISPEDVFQVAKEYL